MITVLIVATPGLTLNITEQAASTCHNSNNISATVRTAATKPLQAHTHTRTSSCQLVHLGGNVGLL